MPLTEFQAEVARLLASNRSVDNHPAMKPTMPCLISAAPAESFPWLVIEQQPSTGD